MSTAEEALALTMAHRERAQSLNARIEAALKRISDGLGVMRIPADLNDPDLVLADCRDRIAELEATIEAAESTFDDEEAAHQEALARVTALEAEATDLRAAAESAANAAKTLRAEMERRENDCLFEGPHQSGCRDGEPQCFGCAMRKVKTLTEERDAAQREAVSEQSNRCDIEADLQQRGGVDISEGLRDAVFELLAQRDQARAELTAERAMSEATQLALESRDAAYAVRVAELKSALRKRGAHTAEECEALGLWDDHDGRYPCPNHDAALSATSEAP